MEINRELKGKVGIEYCRKSTESEERQAFSLEDQHTVNQKTIKRHGIKIKKVLRESRSAKKRGRPLFNEMITGIEEGKYEVIVAWALNRLSRNSVDGALLIELMDEGKLFAIVTQGKVYHNTGEDKLLLSIEFGLSKKYSDDLSPAVKRGMYSKLARGWWPGCPKRGYLNIRRGEEVVQVIDEERFPLLRKAIELYLTGPYSVSGVLDILNNKWGYRTRKTAHLGGTKLCKSSLYKMLNDPYLYGKWVWGGQEVKMHESLPRLATEGKYWQIQSLLGRRGVPRPKTHKDLPYRGLIKCACGCSVVPYIKEKKLASGETKTYYYASCSRKKPDAHCKQPQIPLHELESQISELLDKITVSDMFFNWAVKWLKKDHEIETEEQSQVLNNLNRALERNQSRLNNLLDVRLDSDISPEVYASKKAELKKERESLQRGLRSLETRTDDWATLSEKTFNFARYAKYRFEHGTFAEKTTILRNLGSNFVLKDRKLSLNLRKELVILKENRQFVGEETFRLEPQENAYVTAQGSPTEALIQKWSGTADSNREPLRPKRSALPIAPVPASSLRSM